MALFGPELPWLDVTGTNTRLVHVQRIQKVLPKRQFSTDPEPPGAWTMSNGDPMKGNEGKRSFKNFVEIKGACDVRWTCAPVVSQQYITGTMRHIRTRDTERTESVENFHRRGRHACVWGISIRARMWRGGIQLELVLSACRGTMVSAWGYYRMPAGKRERGGGGKEKSLAQVRP